ncbi:MAG TPA: VOC family protein [Planctomycetota bacterium]|nr:VOC family protein [Planctomycetota bacterium]
MRPFTPPGYHTITPYLVVPDVQGQIDFLVRAFGAIVFAPPLRGPDGVIQHAEVRIGDSVVMMGRAGAEHPATRTMLNLYVERADDAYRAALAAGATSVREPMDQFYGDRSGIVRDRFGNDWCVATNIEDVAPDELERRIAAMSGP